jgi:hypothetical protein
LFLIGILLGRKTEEPQRKQPVGDKIESTPVESNAGLLGKLLPAASVPTIIFAEMLAAVTTLPSCIGTWQFVPLVLLVRLIMALPFLLPALLRLLGDRVIGDQQMALSRSAFQLSGMWVACILTNIWQAGFIDRPSHCWESLNRSSAVSALGYDMIIGIVGLVLFSCLDGLNPDVIAQ